MGTLYWITAAVVEPQLGHWVECRGTYPVLGSFLLLLHHAVATPGFSLVWAIGLLVLCFHVGGRQFGLMMTVVLLLGALAAGEGLAALYLSAQVCDS